jgi:hypothetical protein
MVRGMPVATSRCDSQLGQPLRAEATTACESIVSVPPPRRSYREGQHPTVLKQF